MSADIIPFVPRPRSGCRRPDETPILFRPRPQADDLVMDHADTAPCEYWPWCDARQADPLPKEESTMPKAVTEIRSLARSHTSTALKLLIWDKVFGLGTTDGLAGFASTTANLIVASYFAKRGFENVARIIKR